MQGTVKKLVQDKGYGFIRIKGGRDIFFHRSSMLNKLVFDGLKEGDDVTFELDEGDAKGPRAEQVDLA